MSPKTIKLTTPAYLEDSKQAGGFAKAGCLYPPPYSSFGIIRDSKLENTPAINPRASRSLFVRLQL